MERYKGLCVTNYEGNKTLEIQDMVLLDIKYDIINTFNYSFITKGRKSYLRRKKYCLWNNFNTMWISRFKNNNNRFRKMLNIIKKVL